MNFTTGISLQGVDRWERVQFTLFVCDWHCISLVLPSARQPSAADHLQRSQNQHALRYCVKSDRQQLWPEKLQL